MVRLAVSRPKADFLQSLGLSNDNPGDRQVYLAIKREAMDGRARLCQGRENLVPQCRDDPAVQPPFSSSQIMETAMHREVLRIYSLANPATKPYYLLGQYMDGGNEDNWVIRWMLWNAFRYGMNRKRPPDPDDLLNSPEGSPPFNSAIPSAAQPSERRSVPYDPVRDA